MKKILYIVILLTSILVLNAQEDLKNYDVKGIYANSRNLDFGTTFYGKDKVVFSSQSGRLLNLYIGNIENKDIRRIRLFSRSRIKNTHESNVAFTNDLKTIYFSRSTYGKEKGGKTIVVSRIKIFKATIDSKGNWINEQPMPFNSEKYDVAHPTLNKENTKLYFTSNMPGTFGDNDIFVVDINPDGTYSEPQNLGPNVNTSGKEMFPFISGDDFLYFSSTGHKNNLGGLDVYRVQVNSQGVSKAVHLNIPIISKADDFSYVYNNNVKIGFFSSNRSGGMGMDDIYIFTEKSPKEEPKKEVKPTIPCSQKITGKVFINATKKIIPLVEIVLMDNKGKSIKNTKSKADGSYAFINLKCNNTYFLEAKKDGFSSFSKTVKTPNKTAVNDTPLYLVKDKETKPKPTNIRIGRVDFNYNESKILKRYAYELDLAIKVLKKNPNLIIEFESHTDSRAEDEFNMQLTEERIEAIKEYMGFKGIQSNRIKGTAYGETKPLNKCVNGSDCTEEEYLINRRTTFVIKEKK